MHKNWKCSNCQELNPPRRDECWHCGNGRSISTVQHTSKIWSHLLQISKILGVVSAIGIIVSLFLPWVIRRPLDGPLEIYAGYATIYGWITAVIGLILLFFMVKPDLRKAWYIFAIILAITAYFVSWVPVQMSQVFDVVTAKLGGLDTETSVSIAGIGVSVVNVAVGVVILAALAQFFRPAKLNFSRS